MGKQHKNMDRTSGAMAKFLDAKREEHKKRTGHKKAAKPHRGGQRR
jgi:hypothetical protein